ncbi:DUF5719 family protein [Nesterenkonia natronophila]|uniref:Large extracellular alpha-helical protein n=1 Tax=Nesterenkonia natronophila TaxID=2174932 RepID=A0A3A4F1Z5_9MICC|nr:DUF5719 family protein [Nesterenkonia natronophila]RJN32073.1 hypothetical protein D3250_08290 [Nesterenkonia natronophila]
MTSRKVRKYLKAQQKARRRAQRDQTRGTDTQVASTPNDRVVRAAPTVAVLAGLGLIATVVGSAAMEMTGETQEQPVVLEPHAVAGPEVAETLTCPSVPGRPETLSEQGVLEYEERDDSAAANTTAMVFAATDGKFPAVEWFALDDQGRGEAENLISEGNRDDATEGPLADRPFISGEFETEEGVHLLEVEPLPGRSPSRAAVAAAAYSYSADSGPVTGLTAGMCDAPGRSQWFLGPETGAGANSLLTLANPHSRDATAEVRTYDADGDTGMLGSATVLIPQNSVRTVNVAGIAEPDSEIAVHVQASGAPVAGHLQSASAAGGSGLGVEVLTALPGPQQQHIAVGVPAGSEEDPQLWFYAPGDESVTVELQVFGPDGQVETDTPGVFTVEPGRVSAPGLHGLPSGTYDIVVNSDLPTLAAVRSAGDGQPVTVEVDPEPDPIAGEEIEAENQEQERDPIADFSWSAAAEPLSAGSGAVLPREHRTDLRFLAPSEDQQAQVTYRLLDSEGERTDDLVLEVPAGASAEVTYDDLVDHSQDGGLADLSAVIITAGEGEVFGGTVTRDEAGGFTSTPIVPISPSAQYVPLRVER